MAGNTQTINLGTNVVIVPEHQPAVLAKSVATLTRSPVAGCSSASGSASCPEEYAAVGMEFTNRGRRMDESIEAMRALWTEEVASYHGRFVDFESVRCDPSPPRGTIPLHVGGIVPGRAPPRRPSTETATSRSSARGSTSTRR